MNMTAERLKELRGEKRSQAQVELQTGVKQRTLSRWEGGDIPEALDNLCSLANYYKVSTDYLLGLTDDPRPNRKQPLGTAEGLLVDRIRLLSPGHQRIISGVMVVLLAEQGDRRAIYRRLVEEYMRLLSDDSDGDDA